MVKSVQWPTCPSPVHPEKWTKFLLAHPVIPFITATEKGINDEFHVLIKKNWSLIHCRLLLINNRCQNNF